MLRAALSSLLCRPDRCRGLLTPHFLRNALWAGAALDVFTDGMTEVGRSRTRMLGVEGVAAPLAASVTAEQTDNAKTMAEHLVRRLIAGINELELMKRLKAA